MTSRLSDESMLKANLTEILATGPVFHPDGDPSRRQRTLLLQHRKRDTLRLEYIVASKTLVDGQKSELVKLAATKHFTTAVRLYCDHVLDQAMEDDRAVDDRRVFRRALG
jgi:hypothetical protein